MQPHPNTDLHSRPFVTTPPPAPLSKLQQNIVRIEQEAEAKRVELETAVTHATRVQQRLSGLQRDCDNAADQLVRADAQHATFKNAVETVKEAMLGAWGKTTHIDGDATMPDYSHVAAFNEAIKDYARVRPYLQEQVAQAEAALRKFTTDNDL
jgi:hypothetical protein